MVLLRRYWKPPLAKKSSLLKQIGEGVAANRQSRVSVISLDDRRIVRAVFSKISHTSTAHRELRLRIFRQIANSPELQRMVLDLLSKHPEVQKKILQELAKSPQLRRKFFAFGNE